MSLWKYRAAWITVGLFVVIEVVIRLAPMQYGMGAGVFLTTHRRELAEGKNVPGQTAYDYIIFGESRSLSLNGHRPTPDAAFSVYNLSLPAMGSRYYPYYLRKYLEGRDTPPAALIFAADPGVFQESWGRPVHDPGMRYADAYGESVWQYLSKRTTRRVLALWESPAAGAQGAGAGVGWDSFSHRFLHLFSPLELAQQFTGAERLFLLREALPLQYYTYRYRDSLRHHLSGLSRNYFDAVELPPECDRCENLDAPQCRPKLSKIQDNRLIEARLARTNGGINLGDRLTAVQRLQYALVREQLIKETARRFETARPDLEPLERLLVEAGRAGIRVVLAPTPSVEAYRATAYYRAYFTELARLLERYPQATTVSFPRPYIAAERFVDQIHYDCSAAAQVNADFYQVVMPQIQQFAPPFK